MTATTNTYKMSDRERANLQKAANYNSVRSISEIWPLAAQRFGQTVALHDPHSKPEVIISYHDLNQQIQQFASGLQELGVVGNNPETNTPERVALFADNSPRWMIADQGIIAAGAADVVRSATADPEELFYILTNSGSSSLVVENLGLLRKFGDRLQDLPIHLIVLLTDEEPDSQESLPIVNFSQVLAKGKERPLTPSQQNRDTLATLLYTSGTTGKPKGVMLTHGNLLYQLDTLSAVIETSPGDSVLSILPTWHTFGRTGEYFFLSQGCSVVYTSIRHFKNDLKEFKPLYMTSVPRIWESVYEGIQKQLAGQPANKQKLAKFFFTNSERYIEARRIARGLTLDLEPPSPSEKFIANLKSIALWPIHALGDRLVYQKIREATGGRFKLAISGGGSLATHLENFFEIVGLELIVGYGLTETSPVLTARHHWENLRRSAGKPIPGTELRVVEPETRQPLPVGDRGLVLARGPQIMAGYYQNPEATAKAIDSEGWFDTGDLGLITPNNDLILTGRAKDTIVLTNGENIEPQPIEDACVRSIYIDQIMLVGQDQKFLGALIVPNLDNLEKWAVEQKVAQSIAGLDLNSKPVRDLFAQELKREVKNRPSYRPDDRIGPFTLISEPFTMENGLMTQTLKIKRPVVMERYRDMINGMFD
ncbi:MAG: AMP-binding protein [Cyanobacteriota bacterium]|nr:AMP-binding protein [Cyanobacteriota bacterium]